MGQTIPQGWFGGGRSMSQKEMPEISVSFWLFKISAKGKDGIRLAAAMSFAGATLSVALRSPLATHWGTLKGPMLAILELVRQWVG
jgi:hypothetical protein